MLRRPLLTLLAIAGLATLAGCSRSSNPVAPKPSGFGSVTMSLTDAPAAYDHLYLDVREVWVHRVDDGTRGDTLCSRDDERHHERDHEGGASDTLGGHDGEDSTGSHHDRDHERDEHGMWHRIDATAGIVDLLDLQNGVFKTLATGRVPAGVYNQVRLKLGPSNSIVVDGVEQPLKVPSGQSSGYKLFGRFEVPVEGNVDVGIDFDAARSVHQTGNGMWILRPVARIYEISTTGRIHGRVDPGAAVSWVYAMQGADTIAATRSAGDGGFTLALLPPGDYAVHITPTLEGFRDTTLSPVHVEAGHTTELGVIVLGGDGTLPGRLIGQVYPSTFPTLAALSQGGVIRDTMRTAADGRFGFDGLAPGSYDLTLTPSSADYQDKHVNGLLVNAGATTDAGLLTLEPRPATGDVSGNIVPGDVTTLVVLLSSTDAPLDSVSTETATGNFAFHHVAAGTYGLALKPPTNYEPRYFGPFTVSGGIDNPLGAIYLSPAVATSALTPRR